MGILLAEKVLKISDLPCQINCIAHKPLWRNPAQYFSTKTLPTVIFLYQENGIQLFRLKLSTENKIIALELNFSFQCWGKSNKRNIF